MRKAIRMVLTLLLVAVPASALADTIPSAAIEVSAVGGTPISTAGTVSGSAFNGGPEGGTGAGTATASFSGGDASVSASGSTSGGVSTANSDASAEVTFYFEVEGSAPGVTSVPLIFTGSTSTSASGPDTAAYAYFETPGGGFFACSATGDAVGTCGSFLPSYSGPIDYAAAPEALYDEQVIASGSSSLGTGSWSASVDPQVEIDPTFQYADDFTLVFSPDVPGTPTAAPESSTLSLLGAGLLVLLFAATYKRPATK